MTRTHPNIGRGGSHPGSRPPKQPRLTHQELRAQYDLNGDGTPYHADQVKHMRRNEFQSYHPVGKTIGWLALGLVAVPLGALYTYSQFKNDPGETPHLRTPGTVAEAPGAQERPVPNGDQPHFTFTAGTERSVVYCQQPYVSEQGEKIANALVSPGTYDDEYWHRANVEYKGTEIGVGWTQDTFSAAGHWEVPGDPNTITEYPKGISCKQTVARAEVHPVVGGGSQLFLVDLDPEITRPAEGAPIDLSKPTSGVIDQHLGPAA